MSIDPASGKKATAVVVWEGTEPVDFRDIDHTDYLAVSGVALDIDLMVMEVAFAAGTEIVVRYNKYSV